MNIFYTASFYGKEKYQKYYDLVLKAIKRTKTEIISPEIGNYKSLLSKREIKRLGNKDKIHREAIRRGIEWADAVIIEISHEDFQLGHEATIAMQSKKHVLCLSIHQNFDEKINLRYFHGVKYNEYDVNDTIKTFIETAKRSLLNERFNFFLSPRQLTHLGQVSKKHGINKSEYLRKLIDQDKLSENIN